MRSEAFCCPKPKIGRPLPAASKAPQLTNMAQAVEARHRKAFEGLLKRYFGK